MNLDIYTLDYCPYCRAALEFFKEHKINYHQIRIDDNEEEMLKKLANMFNIKGEATVPQIILDGVRIGGYDDMMKQYKEGMLKFPNMS